MGWRSHILGSEPWGIWSVSEGCRQGGVRVGERGQNQGGVGGAEGGRGQGQGMDFGFG